MCNPDQTQEINHDALDSYLHDYISEHLEINTKVHTEAYEDNIYVSTTISLDGEEISSSEDYIDAGSIVSMANDDHWDD